MDVVDLKPTLLLALAIFLASAPNPDSKAIAEMTANLVVPKSERSLQAAETPVRKEADTLAVARRAATTQTAVTESPAG